MKTVFLLACGILLLNTCTLPVIETAVAEPPKHVVVLVVEGLLKTDFEVGPLAELKARSLWFHNSETGHLPTSSKVTVPVIQTGRLPRELPFQDEISVSPNAFKRSDPSELASIPHLMTEVIHSRKEEIEERIDSIVQSLPPQTLLVVVGTASAGDIWGPAFKGSTPPARFANSLKAISFEAAVYQESLRLWLKTPDFVAVAIAARNLGKLPDVESVYSLKKVGTSLHYVLSYQSEESRTLSTDDPVPLLDTFKTDKAPDIVAFFKQSEDPTDQSPLLIYAPDWFVPGSENFDRVRAVDVFPIIRQTMRLPMPEGISGVAPKLEMYQLNTQDEGVGLGSKS